MDVTAAAPVEVTTPDASQIDRGDCEVRGTQAIDGDRFVVLVREPVWAAMREHARTRLDAEVGGVMLGRVCVRDDDPARPPYLLIDAYVPALAATSHAANVTFTADTWTTIHDVIDREHPDAKIVGWYHTHPNFGIFLSEMDVFIQRHFFDLPHQVAIVIDPIADTHGCFVWRGGVPTDEPLIVEAADGTAVVRTAAAASMRSDTDFRAIYRQRQSQRAARPRLALRAARGAWRVAKDGVGRLRRLDREQWLALTLLASIVAFLLVCLAAVTLAEPQVATAF